MLLCGRMQLPHGEVAVGVGGRELVAVVGEPHACHFGEGAGRARRPHAARVAPFPQLDGAVGAARQVYRDVSINNLTSLTSQEKHGHHHSKKS